MIAEALRNMFAGISFDGVHPRDPVIKEILGLGQKSTSGVDVDYRKVLAIPAVKRGVQIVTDKIFGMPWYVFSEHEDGREFAKSHPAWKCVTSQANSDMDDATLRQQLTQWAMLWGNGCAVIYRPPGWPDSGDVELVPLLPDRTQPVRIPQWAAESAENPDMAGQLMYETIIGGEKKLFARSDVIHIKGMGENPFWGANVIDLMCEAFGGVIAKEQFGNRFFGQGANPSGFIEKPGGMDEESEENFVESLRRAMEGLGRAHKIVLLEEGSKFHPITVDPLKSQMIEGRQFDVRIIAMCIGIKPHKLIDGANSAFASLEQANQEHKDDDILPWINKWRKEYNTKLLTDDQRFAGTYSIDVDDEELEWVPFSERAAGTVELYNNGLINKDEGRRKVNFGPSRTDKAKSFRIPSNIVYEDAEQLPVAPVTTTDSGPADETPADDEQDASDDNDDGSAASELETAYLTNIRTRLAKIGQAKAKQGSKAFLTWLDGLEPEAGPGCIQVQIDAVYKSFCESANQIALRATTDGELRRLCDALGSD